MNDFKIIYKILKTLHVWRGREDFEIELISATAMETEFCDWEQLIIELQRNGYIDGVMYSHALSDAFPHIIQPITPRITLKGIEFLKKTA